MRSITASKREAKLTFEFVFEGSQYDFDPTADYNRQLF